MLIKGTVGGKGPNRGNIIEYSGEEKVPHMIRAGLSEGGLAAASIDSSWLYSPIDGSVSNVKIETMPKGDLLRDLWQNNRYTGTAAFEYYARSKSEKQTVKGPFKATIAFTFEDALDDMRMPDIKITKADVSLSKKH